MRTKADEDTCGVEGHDRPFMRRKISARGMRHPSGALAKPNLPGGRLLKKLEIIRKVGGSHLPAKKTLDMRCIPRSIFLGGMTAISKAGLMRWQIGLLDRDQSGTVFRKIGAIIQLNLCWSIRRLRLVTCSPLSPRL